MINMQNNTFDISAGARAVRHNVLRNTYWLLALSMVPTVLGAVIGVAAGLPMPRGGLGVLLFLGIAWGFIWGIEKNKESGLGVALLLGFTFFMGLMLTPLLSMILGFSNGVFLIMTAFGGTAGVFFGMATLATVVKRDLSALSRFLFVGIMIAIVASLVNFFVQSTAAFLAISVAVTAISSLFILVDVKRVIDGGEDNYITAALSIYIDLYNVFQNLLVLLTIFTGDRR